MSLGDQSAEFSQRHVQLEFKRRVIMRLTDLARKGTGKQEKLVVHPGEWNAEQNTQATNGWVAQKPKACANKPGALHLTSRTHAVEGES